jgi:tetrapyrrole methylase family protein/MazG family protein
MSDVNSSPFPRLVEVMARLRGEGGCPWDRQQTHETLKAYLVEEAYEVIDAIDKRDDLHLREELGDLLLQVVFHAQIAGEEGRFDIDSVIEGIIAKLIRRHPHVFGDLVVRDAQEVLSNWERFKREETQRDGSTILAGIPEELPALLRARRIQEKAARIGFDWSRIEDVFAKVEEEFQELRAAFASHNPREVEDEVGDLLFAVVNLSRFLHICPEDTLRKTITRFIERFRYIEEGLRGQGKEIGEATLDEMEALWQEAKQK